MSNSQFDNYAIDAAEHQFDMFGRDILFGASEAEAETITAIVGSCDEVTSDDELGETRLKFRQLTIPIADMPETISGYVAVIEDETWTIEEVLSKNAAMVKLQCKWAKIKSRHHETHLHKIKG